MIGAVRYEIEHVSRYRYESPVKQSAMLLCLEPHIGRSQRLLSFEIETHPPVAPSRETDSFGNTRHVLAVHRAHRSLQITARSTVETRQTPPLPTALGPDAWTEIRAMSRSFLEWDFTHPSMLIPTTPALDTFVRRHRIEPGEDPLESLLQLSDTLHGCLYYMSGSTSVESPVNQVLETDQGVCQDFAHAMIAVARSWGIPSRYVSGYLYLTGDPGEQTPANTSHAWTECRLPDIGWVGFDPTNQILPDERHVRVATGRDYHDVSPTRGVILGGGEARLEVDVRMRIGGVEADSPATLPPEADSDRMQEADIVFQTKEASNQ